MWLLGQTPHMTLHSTPTIQKTFKDYSESILESPSWAEWSEWSNDGADKPCGEGTNYTLNIKIKNLCEIYFQYDFLKVNSHK